MAKRSSRKAEPWDRENPKTRSGHAPRKLSAAKKASARARARRAGRPYPNLVDNMAVARKSKGSGRKKSSAAGATRKRTTKKKSTAPRKSTAKKRTAGARRRASSKKR